MLDYKSVMDTFFEKGDPKLLVDEIHRRQKVSHRGKGCRSSVTNRKEDHHPSVKIIPPQNSPVRMIIDGKGKMSDHRV